MASRRALAAAGCLQCRASSLRLFAAPPAAPPIPIRPRHVPSWPSAALTNAPSRSYSSSGPPSPPETRDADATPPSEASEGDAGGDVPWYLKVEPPGHLFAAQSPPLPEVPSDAPPIVSSVLEYASEEMGLEELALLDLRKLDPPPGLGPNLFMFFGTARSERHLHVSAGRLVRWLRAKHRVHADADGLLGPNERKTKLRRKARRAKLMGTMGTDEADDGITTGWICVNLGTVNRSLDESVVFSGDGRAAGFGVTHQGTTIVVQVMTESRRAELGLESLWLDSLARQEKKVGDQPRNQTPEGQNADSHPVDKPVLSNSPSRPSLSQKSSDHSPFSGQSRFFSSSETRRSSTESASIQSATNDPMFESIQNDTLAETLVHDGASKLRLLELLRLHLQGLEWEEAARTLESDSFKTLATLAMQHLPAAQTWALRLVMQTKARLSGLDAVSMLANTRKLVQELRVHAIPATRQQILELIGCIFAVPDAILLERRLVEDVLECLHLRGEAVIANDVIVTIIEATSWAGPTSKETMLLQKRLEKSPFMAKLPYMGDALLMRLVEAYIRLRRPEVLWDTWRIPSLFGLPRSEAMYIQLYEAAAATRSALFCTVVLRKCFHDMMLETPPVMPFGRVRDVVMECIRVADPKAEEDAATLPSGSSGFTKMLERREFVRLVKAMPPAGMRGPPASQ